VGLFLGCKVERGGKKENLRERGPTPEKKRQDLHLSPFNRGSRRPPIGWGGGGRQDTGNRDKKGQFAQCGGREGGDRNIEASGWEGIKKAKASSSAHNEKKDGVPKNKREHLLPARGEDIQGESREIRYVTDLIFRGASEGGE